MLCSIQSAYKSLRSEGNTMQGKEALESLEGVVIGIRKLSVWSCSFVFEWALSPSCVV